MTPPFFTIGHSNRGIDAFIALLRGSGVRLVADIRKLPGSRANPQFDHDRLSASLAAQGIGYEHIAALGGLRGKAAQVPPEANAYWTNASFHRYADYALSGEFRDGLQHLVDAGRERTTAMMCAEAVWWRCHRRIVADYLLARGERVFHILGEGRIEPARMTDGAVPQTGGTVLYPASMPPT